MQSESKESLGSTSTGVEEIKACPQLDTYETKPSHKSEYARIGLSFFIMLQIGMCDASLGALLTSMQTRYNLSYSLVSFIFLVNVVGWAGSGPFVPLLLHRLGMRYTLLLACILNIVGGIILVLDPPFPVTIVGLLIFGIAGGINDSAASTYIARLAWGNLMSVLYAFISVGALITPVLIAGMLERGASWHAYYYAPIGTAVVTGCLTWFLFKGYTTPLSEQSSSDTLGGQYKQTLLAPAVMMGAALMMLSYATSDIISGWVVSFLIDVRHGEAISMRYILAGFWTGQIIGRLALVYPITRLRNGEKVVVPIYLLICVGLLSVLQFVKNLIGVAVTIAFIGMLIGPVSPTVLTIVSNQISPSQLSPAVAILTTLGLLGSAAGPLIVGFINNAGGLRFLGAILMGVVGVLLALWLWATLKLWSKNTEDSSQEK